jgi:hypothetical protein
MELRHDRHPKRCSEKDRRSLGASFEPQSQRVLKRQDTRRAAYPHELDDHIKQELKRGYRGPHTPRLDNLLNSRTTRDR